MSNAIVFPQTGKGLKYTLGNRMFKLVMKTPAAAKMDPMWILDVKGRRTGRQVKTPVGLHELDGQHLMLAGGRWRFNFAGEGQGFALDQGTRRITGHGTLVEDVDQVADAYEKLITKFAQEKDTPEKGIANASRMTGCELGAGRLPTRDEIKAALADQSRAVVYVTLD